MSAKGTTTPNDADIDDEDNNNMALEGEGWDCGALLDQAAAEEAGFSMQFPTSSSSSSAVLDNFGHPDPPKLAMFPIFCRNLPRGKHTPVVGGHDENTDPVYRQEPHYETRMMLEEEVVLAVAYTEHCVVAQVLKNNNTNSTSGGAPSEVLIIGSLPVLEQADGTTSETITCLTIVPRGSLDFLQEENESSPKSADAMHDTDAEEPTGSPKEADNNENNDDGVVPMDTSPDDSDEAVTGPTATLLPQEYHVAIVVGTSHTRVYSTEILITISTNSNENHDTLDTRLEFSPIMVARNARFVEVLPKDDEETIELLDRYERRHRGDVSVQPFVPEGKVLSIVPFRLRKSLEPNAGGNKDEYGTYLWISFQDGSLVRLYHAAIFPSVWEIGASRQISLEELLQPATADTGDGSGSNRPPVVRCKVMLPPKKQSDVHIIPLPRYRPSPLAPLPTSIHHLELDAQSATSSMDEMFDKKDETKTTERFEALVFGDKDDPLSPTLAFYTSEDQFVGRIKGDDDVNMSSMGRSDSLISSFMGSTKSVVEGVAGVFGWGRRGSAASSRRSSFSSIPDTNLASIEVDHANAELPVTPFPSLWKTPLPLYAGYEFHDAPREMESCAVDPDGRLAALSDSLGRVLLVDLSTKQIVRMWKGFRETTCHWMQSKPSKGNSSELCPTTHLAIHSRHRRVVEIWRIRQGPRVQLTQVSRDAILVSSPMVGRCDLPSNCVENFLVQSVVPGGENQFERLCLPKSSPNGVADVEDAPEASHVSSNNSSSRGAALRLQHLRQLLSATDLQYTKNDIFEAVRKIKSLGDLVTAIDLISTASALEDRLGVQGSSFQKCILEYCTETLSEATRDRNTDILHSPSAKTLSRKINFYSRLVKAYDIIDSFSMSEDEKMEVIQDAEPFVKEAKGWVETFETVTGSPIVDEGASKKKQRIRFSAFAASVVFPSNEDQTRGVLKIYFSDSSRTRGDVLVHIFQPLLGAFSSGVVGNFFDIMGIREDDEYIQKCFGEWFMTLSSEQMIKHGLSMPESPMSRFLEDISGKQALNESATPLDALFAFCCKSVDLIRAFVLGTLCRRAVIKSAGRIENVSYGKVSLSRLTFDWDAMLRKCRVCLLAALRLNGERLGTMPLSVYNLEVENEFSVYEWLARDELAITHRQEEIVILEGACRMSTYSFDPFSDKADSAARISTLQKTCLRGHGAVLDGDDVGSSTLLLYFRHHNNPTILAAHRSLLLASSWLKDPENLTILADSLETAKSMKDEPSLALAVRLELWTRVVCPVYRARLFGFVDVPELVEEDFAPLLQQRRWLDDFGRLSLRVLDLVTEVEWNDDLNSYDWPESGEDDEVWPQLRTDYILERALRKVRPLDETSRDAHYVVICGLLISEDMNALAPCVPAIYDCFLSLSIFNPVTVLPSPSPEQDTFLASAILLKARNYNGPPLENFRLGELAILGEKWGFSLPTLRSLYLLAMYEFGKDLMVDDLLTRAFTQIDATRFLDGGLDTLCRRLDAFFQSDFMKKRHMREVMGVLDADLCDWIQQQAAMAADTSPVWESKDPLTTLNLTHTLALRLLSLSKTANVDTTLRVKIHSLAVLSGTLLKEVEESRRVGQNDKQSSAIR